MNHAMMQSPNSLHVFLFISDQCALQPTGSLFTGRWDVLEGATGSLCQHASQRPSGKASLNPMDNMSVSRKHGFSSFNFIAMHFCVTSHNGLVLGQLFSRLAAMTIEIKTERK